jgi:hypothetical protein
MDWMQNKQRILRILEQRTSVNSETGCWEYEGVDKTTGYGQVVIDHVKYHVHRISAVLFLGYKMEQSEIELYVLHLPICKSRNCWNFNHLYIGTQTDNMIDKSVSITHCPHGHEYNEENTYFYTKKDGSFQRMCRTCRKIRTDASNQKRKLKLIKEVG